MPAPLGPSRPTTSPRETRQRDVVQHGFAGHRPWRSSARRARPPPSRAGRGASAAVRAMIAASFIVSGVFLGTVKWPVTRPPLWPTPGAPPSITARPDIEVDHQPRAHHLRSAAVELDGADQGDQLACRGRRCRNCRARFPTGCGPPLRRPHRAGGSGSRRRSNRRRVSRSVSSASVALLDVDIAGEDRPVGAVLDLDAVGGDVDRGVAVMALQRRNRVRRHGPGRRRRRAAAAAAIRSGDAAHVLHLTAPCTIFKRAPPPSTTLRSSRSALRLPARNWPSRIAPADRARALQVALLRNRPARRASRADSRRARSTRTGPLNRDLLRVEIVAGEVGHDHQRALRQVRAGPSSR